jgi:hypothetical protein
MNIEDVMRLVIQAEGVEGVGIDVEGVVIDDSMWVEFSEKQLMLFAALVAAHEREECAKLCDKEVGELAYGSDDWYIAKSLALIIRARGET